MTKVKATEILFPKNIYGGVKKLCKQSMMAYIAALVLVSIAFGKNSMQYYWYIWGCVEVLGFFYFTNYLYRKQLVQGKEYERRLFMTSLLIRLIYVCISYWFYFEMTDTYFEFHAGDSEFYHDGGVTGSAVLRENIGSFFTHYNSYLGADLSDSGYPFVLSIIYALTGDSIFLARIVNAVVSAFTVVLMYRFSRRMFGEYYGRLTGIMMMLMPNLIYYCGLHLKETIMVFLVVLFIERADELLRRGNFVLWPTLFVVLIGLSLFFFRTVLGAVALLSLLFAVVLSSTKLMGWGKRIIIGFLSLLLVSVMIENQMKEDIDAILHTDIQQQQQDNMEWRSIRNDNNGTANAFAKYASATIFAPLIFTIPFPTMVDIPLQEKQQMIHGGCYVKNVLSYFVIYSMFLLLLSGEWRKYVLPISLMIGYLFVLVFSTFAQSERFHMPVIPLEIMFAAYGIIQIYHTRFKKWNFVWILACFGFCIVWSWFKLAGRGM